MNPPEFKSEPMPPILTHIPKLDLNPKAKPGEESETGPTKESIVRIDNNSVKSVAPARGKESKSAIAQLLQPADQASVSDDVKLTATSEKLLQLESELSNVDITDTAKIESIRQAIADGNFKVDEEAVAEGLIEETINTIGHRSRQ
ncbi:MAG: flagellar biosynthesis anti-sigma factor FlgM [Hydrogenophilales bacterium 28-61-23]|nr:MAG: flagellar biosynthesis anti-sigma factor FlgM [Hydrogenophilales bacterium 28-61-23]